MASTSVSKKKSTKSQINRGRAKRIAVDLPPEIHSLLKSIAMQNQRTLIGQIEYWCKQNTI